ncbi:MAG TPA: MBL fold metallo-hydrolase [Solirubrobacterales bacterium]|nr:MBL fold metallo-hydrolase [Solirubrobacterales bacterium]
MASGRRDRAVARGERTLPGVWRLRMPLPWPGVPHVNAWALAAGDGIVLFDTGYAWEDGTRQLELALAQVGFRLSDVRLLVCTHAHSAHYGLAGPIVDAAGCELWMHPAWEHIREMADDPDEALDRRIEVARQSGVPGRALREYERSRRGESTGIARAIQPDRELVPGVEVETDAGTWQVYETPGHAPSHVTLYEPSSGMLISGDHLLGRVSLFFDYGHTPDPAGEFLASLDKIERLEPLGLCLPGHGRPFRDVRAKAEANREEFRLQLDRVRAALDGEPVTAFEVVRRLLGPENVNAATGPWGMQMALAYLDHLAARGEVERLEGDGDAHRWRAA